MTDPSLQDYYGFRRNLIDVLFTDLVGPTSEEEIIEDDPLTRYAAGILYPQQSGTIRPENDSEAGNDDDGGEEGNPDPPVALANVRYPASMGLTFAVAPSISSKLHVKIKTARYEPLAEPTSEVAESKKGRRRSEMKKRWKRCPIDIPTHEIDVTKPFSDYQPLQTSEALRLYVRVRTADANGAVGVTVVLLNENNAPEKGRGDDRAFFQSEIEVMAAVSGRSPFVERPIKASAGNDEDIRSYRLLYRHAREFAAGHGCSVDWNPKGGKTTSEIVSRFVPQYAVPLSMSNPQIQAKCVGMQYLATGSQAAVLKDLETLCSGYESWINDRQEEAKTLTELDAEQRATAAEHLKLCREALRRIREGIQALREQNVWIAFQLANAAMLDQRARTVWLKNGKPDSGPQQTSDHQWRPFQLAFILLCLQGLADPKSPERELADLLWFPTGGGKTEAYLGLIAFTIFLRRLRNMDGGGVTALMRYTLRLLTIQQFERATLLICCCEAIRQKKTELGKEPISIGLWLGKGATPNTRPDTRTALNQLRRGMELSQGNPVQIHSCPWCGTDLDHRNYWLSTTPAKLVVSCGTEGCLFTKGLPVCLIDEDVYDHRPTLIIATVDKFASLPWRERAASLFNLADGVRPKQLPPELIIQDELHLISGPLGTLVGLYETAVDSLCEREGVRAKVIASTATIRRAGQQAAGLFNREIRQFPPPGIDARNSYFAVEATPDAKGDRLYLGLMGPGISHTTLLVRAYAGLLQGVTEIPGSNAIKDPYWTLVGYFNSLRVLGGAKLQVQDDVNDRMELLATQHGATKRETEHIIELTSREPSSNIPRHLQHMAVSYPSPDTLSVILATNMISVGVDIDRLGLMAVMGQPQATSEYIQSTSRVGRSYPGLVVVLFNSARSRDRSHYESFVAYHSALYRQVESTSVTPFSARARDRGLHAVVVALSRLLQPALRPNSEAAQIATHRADVRELSAAILNRIESIRDKGVADDEDFDGAREQLRQILERWELRAATGSLVYSDSRNPANALLCDAADPGPRLEDSFPTLWSLRDVDQDSNLYLIRLQQPGQAPTP